MKTEELREYFQESLCIFNLQARDKKSALEEMVDRISRECRLKDRDIILEMLLNRESLGSTAIGKGVAFPHGRTLAIQELTVLFARSADGVNFDSLDKKPTHLFFLIIAPPQDKENLYLQVLGCVVELIKNASKRRKLMEVTSFPELQAIFDS
ncbi:MAG: PTS transporter subunit EIIA [Candidatus Latescibacteria bacterium]|nr:PTS transporter subunit EIIA [Candidatus Latescibacterota bacterium]NIM66438.1 PTS transporter subunit EIIA [Candidatus Latescibacterota bacterium]NIO02918.1 PTS transporter subunit EIIA [Candidatus Latescibacterota bacterium]NIO30053.1 PTS transporter subunit EIIA [Candidatus Latescibacterota bacterium]NIO57668.1 PTS transporter subunit EIIA [Candidatus Latescibacterota bacterium]